MSDRNSLISEIMDIEKEIKKIRTNSTYLRLKENLRKLDNPPFSNRYFTVVSPDDMSQKLEVSRRSKDINPLKEEFKKRINKFDKRLKILYEKRAKLRKRLFG